MSDSRLPRAQIENENVRPASSPSRPFQARPSVNPLPVEAMRSASAAPFGAGASSATTVLCESSTQRSRLDGSPRRFSVASRSEGRTARLQRCGRTEGRPGHDR